MADNRKLTAGILNLPESARQDLARQANEFERFKQADYLRKMGEQGAGFAKSVARGVPQMATGLVDLAAMPFEAAGIVEPGKAIGSTKWLEEKGYLPPPQEGFINQTVEGLASALDPSTMAAHALPAIGMLGKTVWHGSPHTFDKFDLSKIGTGEGAQAYGHGLYFAESPDVAANYAPRNAKYEADLMKRYDKAVNAGQYDKAAIYESAMLHESPAQMKDRFSKSGGYDENQVANYHAIIDKELAPLYSSHNQGMYKVDLPDEQIAKMLDWDKPFSKQPQSVQDAITKYWAENRVYGDPTKLTGEGIYGSVQGHVLGNRGSDIANRSASQEAASMDLNYMGIPGIQYLDQASRGAGDGTRNYVVFSDEIPQILERNNVPVNK